VGARGPRGARAPLPPSPAHAHTSTPPEASVRAAMNEIQAQQRLRQAAREKAEANKILSVTAAEAEAEAKYLQGQGIARQRQAIVAGLRESVKEFGAQVEGVNSRDVLSLMLMTQWLDTMQVGRERGGVLRAGSMAAGARPAPKPSPPLPLSLVDRLHLAHQRHFHAALARRVWRLEPADFVRRPRNDCAGGRSDGALRERERRLGAWTRGVFA